MNPPFTRCPAPLKGGMTFVFSALLLAAQAQPTVVSTSPARNANAAPRPGNVALTYNQAINPATAGNVRVFSQQAGGRKAFASASASGSVLTLDPAQDFKPGEVVFVTAPATVLGTGGAAAAPYVYQFTAQAGAGPGTFSGGSDPAVGNRPSDVAVADVDGDGDLDLLAANYNATPGPSPGTVSVRLNDGAGTFSGSQEVSVGSNPQNVVPADVDGDGDIDLLTANTFGLSVSVRLNNGAGVFAAPATGAEVIVAGSGESIQIVTAFDVDGDGDLDLLTSHYDGASNRVSVRLNNGTGGFVTPATGAEVNVGSGAVGFITVVGADVDGDGDLDLLAANAGSNTVSVRLNDGTGMFTAPVTGAVVSVGNAPYGLAAADVDGDGDLDLLTANVSSNTVSVRLNNGAGVFAAPATGAEVSVGNTASNGAYDVTAADVDGDGDLDLLTANTTNNSVSVRLNNGTGTFAGGQEVAVGLNAGRLTVGDVDGDGDLDLLTANLNSNTVSVRLNQLGGPTVTISTSSANPTSIAPFLVTVTFSQSVTGFTASSITVANGSVSSPLAVNGNAYSFNVTPVAAGAVTVGVAANVAQNAGGFGNTAAAPLVITYQIINTNSVWTGATSTDWFTGSNWTSGVPTAFHDAIINPSSFGRQPVIASGSGTALSRDLVIGANSSLTHTGGTLDVRGDWANNGTFTALGGTVIFGAMVPTNLPGPTIYGSNATRFWNLIVQVNGVRLSTSAGTSVRRLLTLNGTLATLGNPFTLESEPTLAALVVNNGSGVVLGNATVQRAIDPSLNPGPGYRHYGSPVQSTTVTDLTTTGFAPVVNAQFNAVGNAANPFPNVFGYDEARITGASAATQDINYGYFSPGSLADVLVPGRGYIVNLNAASKVDLVGTLNTGAVPVGALTRGNQAQSGWHLLGNPYPAPLDWNLARLNLPAGLVDAVYVYKSSSPYAGSYQFYQNGFGTLPGGLIGSMQGFFVQVTQPVPAFTFLNAWRATTYQNPAFNRATADLRPAVQLELADAQGTRDAAFVYFESGASAGFDTHYDATKLLNSTGLNLASVAAGQPLAVNGLPVPTAGSIAVPLLLGLPATGTYTLHAAQLRNFLPGAQPFLRDVQLGTLTDLSLTPDYTFTMNAANTAPRFELVFGPQQVLGAALAALAAQVAVFPNPAAKAVFIELPASLRQQVVSAALVDAVGRVVRQQALPAGGATHTLLLTNVASGVYSLRLQTEAGTVVKKLVVE